MTRPWKTRWKRNPPSKTKPVTISRHAHLDLPPLDAPPLDGEASKHARRRQARTHQEGLGQRVAVAPDDPGQEFFGYRGAEVGGPRGEDDFWVQAREHGLEVGDQLVDKDALGDGDEQGAAQTLHKDDDGGAHGHVLEVEHGLHGDDGLLHAEAHAGAGNDLVSDPDGLFRARVPRGQQPEADRHDHGGDPEERRVVAPDGDNHSGDERRGHEGQQERQDPDARLDGRHALHGLEPDGDEVAGADEGGAPGEGVKRRRPDGALLDDARRHRGLLVLPPLQDQPDAEEDAEQGQERDDAHVAPRGHDGGHEDDGADRVELLRAGPPRRARVVWLQQLLPGPPRAVVGLAEPERDGGDAEHAKRQVDVEAPAPGGLVGKDAAEQRARHDGDAVHGAQDPGEERPADHGDRVREDDERAGEEPRGPDAGDGAPEDQEEGRPRGAAEQGPQLKQADGREVDPFYTVMTVQLPEEELQGRDGQEGAPSSRIESFSCAVELALITSSSSFFSVFPSASTAAAAADVDGEPSSEARSLASKKES
ncbi:uncharacterized protein PpBr36_10493 [Pyricularia pennisetigena]|uniref:uncharacterized protein n=1 Tax=Pyricularia pennisetigena TaxID=1578925 RepID=UPI001154BC46|nr:uncharacterized protein PpBr36_10493 [Pyricularia pennisetigena]TLS21088.1 hypothetical protein PpBr36_10493 [Pyricularia pennisetigena]